MAVGVGIDMGSRTTRVVTLVGDGGAVRWGDSVAAPAGSADLPARLQEAGIRPRGAVAGLSGKHAPIRYSRVPFAPPWKLRDRVRDEVTQDGGLDVVFDCRALDLPAGPEPDRIMVLTAAAKNETLADRLDSLAARGFRETDFAPAALALFEVFSRCPECQESLDTHCLVLDVGDSNTEMIVTRNGGLVFARSVGSGGRDFTGALAAALDVDEDQAERLKAKHGFVIDPDRIRSRPSAEQPMLTALAGAAEEFFGAIRASLTFAQAQPHLDDLRIGRVYLCGPAAGLGGLAGFLAAKLDARATFLRPPDDWGPPAEPGKPSEWMIAAGLALMSLDAPDKRMSLLPAPVRRRRRFWRRDVFAYAACVVFALTAALAAAVRAHNATAAERSLGLRKRLMTEAAERDRQLAAGIDGNRRKRAQLRCAAAAARAGADAARVVDFIRTAQPDSVGLSSLVLRLGDVNRTDGRATVELEGTAEPSAGPAGDGLREFAERLAKWPWFGPRNEREKQLLRGVPKGAGTAPLPFRIRIPLAIPRGQEDPA